MPGKSLKESQTREGSNRKGGSAPQGGRNGRIRSVHREAHRP